MSDIPMPASVSLVCSHCGCPLKAGEAVCHACGWPLDGPAEADAMGPLPDLAGMSGQAAPGDEVVVLADVVVPRDEVAHWQEPFLKAVALTFLLIIVLALGAMGLGYALFVKLGQGRQDGRQDVSSTTEVPAGPVALAPTGAVGPLRLTELPPDALQPATNAAVQAPAAAEPASSAQAEDDTENADEATPAKDNADLGVDKLLARARSCLANDDLDCAVTYARAVLRQDQQNRAARKVLAEVRAVTAPARAAAVPDAGGANSLDPSGGQTAGDAPGQSPALTPAIPSRQP